MSQTHISPISAAQHYATGAAFWEEQAKLLRNSLDEANELVGRLHALIAHGSPEQLAAAKAQLVPPPVAEPAPVASEPEPPAT